MMAQNYGSHTAFSVDHSRPTYYSPYGDHHANTFYRCSPSVSGVSPTTTAPLPISDPKGAVLQFRLWSLSAANFRRQVFSQNFFNSLFTGRPKTGYESCRTVIKNIRITMRITITNSSVSTTKLLITNLTAKLP